MRQLRFLSRIGLHVPALLGACIAATQVAVAQDGDRGVPVRIVACDVVAENGAAARYTSSSTFERDNLIQIAFVNRSPKTLRDVTFRIESRAGTRTISDVGAFPSGEVVRQTFGPFGDVGREARCEVASATFGEGPAGIRDGETIVGLICSISGKYGLNIRSGDRVDRVTMRTGTEINPIGLQLKPGMLVVVAGNRNGATFRADKIDAPIEMANRSIRTDDVPTRQPARAVPTGTFQTNGPSAEGGG